MEPERQHETQQSVHQWCKDTFPRHVGIKGRAVALLEEAAELAIPAGVSYEALHAALEVPIKKDAERVMERIKRGEDAPPREDAEEVADVLLCVYAYAEEAGYDAHEELDTKMAINRSRTPEYYAKKTARKEELGFILPDAPNKK